jgi:YD repeat-containing protein
VELAMMAKIISYSFKRGVLALSIFSLCAFPCTAQANGLVLLGPQLGSSLLLLLNSGSHCTLFTYDPNGNRISQTNSTVGSGVVVWGTDRYGCTLWG